jgi:hypothetical protein
MVRLREAIMQRCYNINHTSYHRYGGRGIEVCERWRLSTQNLIDDMGFRPKGLTMDRIDNNGNYEPGNCRWATYKINLRNTSRNRMITYDGQSLCLTAWSELLHIPVNTIRKRMSVGWDLTRVFSRNTTPPIGRF